MNEVYKYTVVDRSTGYKHVVKASDPRQAWQQVKQQHGIFIGCVYWWFENKWHLVAEHK